MSRSGRTREPRTSDQRPTPMRRPAASTCETASTAAAAPRREAVRVVEEEHDEAHERDLRDEVEPARRSTTPEPAIAERRLDVRGIELVLGARERRTSAPDERAGEDERGEEEEARIERLPSTGMATAAITPPTGTAVCRTPSASPRSPLGNQPMTARPLPDCTLPPKTPPSRSRATSDSKSGAKAAPSKAYGAAGQADGERPAARRSGRRRSPQGSIEKVSPTHSAATTTPTCVEREVVLVPDRGREHRHREAHGREGRLRRRPGGEHGPAVAPDSRSGVEVAREVLEAGVDERR